jgi:two-component system, NarL family, response regulator NreC
MSPARSDAGSHAGTRLRLRTLVAHEPGLFCEGVTALLDLAPEIEVVGHAEVGIDALKTAAALQAQLVLLELPEGARKGPRLISSLKSQLHGLRVIVLAHHCRAAAVEATLRAGADGYVLKSDSRAELFAAIASIAGGKSFISPSLRQRDPTRERASKAAAAAAPELTDRELQVMRFIAGGRRTREIAKMLSLSHKTIEKHRASLMRKLGLRNATAVAAYAIASGLAE